MRGGREKRAGEGSGKYPVYGEEEAVRRGLETAQAGDLLVIFGDKLDRDWEQI